jgi:hypothetical protein
MRTTCRVFPATLAATMFTVLLTVAACTPDGAPTDEPAAGDTAALPAEQLAFWDNLRQQCGEAYGGGLTLEPPGDDMLTGTEQLIVHFRECADTEIRAPFHIEKEAADSWDRSRTWIFRQTADGLELRHDHRHEDGTEADSNFYGGFTQDRGTAEQQHFIFTERTGPAGELLGWRVEIVPGERYTYGTIRDDEWTWRVDFDLTRPVPPPPAPWGHD